MTESKTLQLLRLEYENGNTQRAIELADALILESVNDEEIGLAWIYKAVCTAELSSVSRERLLEGVSYIKEAQKIIPNDKNLLDGAKLLSEIIKCPQMSRQNIWQS